MKTIQFALAVLCLLISVIALSMHLTTQSIDRLVERIESLEGIVWHLQAGEPFPSLEDKQ